MHRGDLGGAMVGGLGRGIRGCLACCALASLVGAGVGGCSAPGGASTPGARLRVVVSAVTATSSITRVAATATPGGVTQDLAYQASDGTFSGILAVPAGVETIRAEAWAGPTLVGAGSASVTVAAGATAQVALTLLDTTGPPPLPPHAPLVTSFSVASTAGAVGVPIAVAGTAFDADGAPVSFAWTTAPAGCGAFADPAAASTAFTPASPGACTVRLTVTASGLSDARSATVTVAGTCGDTTSDPLNCGTCRNVCPSGTCTAGACVDVRTAIDPLPQPPNGRTMWPTDSGARPTLLVDRAPGAAGDLVGLFYAGNGTAGDAWYLLRSRDAGASFEYLAASNAEPSPDPANRPPGLGAAIAQDSVAWRLHVATAPHADPQLRYHRVALARGADGHVTGWTWEAENVPGPTFATAGAYDRTAKLALTEAVDGTGAHALVLVAMDQPEYHDDPSLPDPCIKRLLACRAAPAAALAPAAATDWVGLAGGGATCDLVESSAVGPADTCLTHVAGNPPAAITALTGQSKWTSQHVSDFAVAQLRADGSLHVFDGPMYYDDAWIVVGDVHRWRFLPGGAWWTVDPASAGQVVAAADSAYRPSLGAASATPTHVWLAYGSRTGLHVDRVGADGAWVHDAVAQPDLTPNAPWWAAISVTGDESRVYAAWEVWDFGLTPPWRERSGHWDGTAWTIADDSATFARYSLFQGSTSWNVIPLDPGVGVLAYGAQDWATSTQHYHVHTLR